MIDLVRKRRLPIIGDGAGVWSFVHVDDVATATMGAIERGAPGAYNVVDDEPAAVHDWLPELATAIGAKPPRRIPVWLGRLAAGEAGVSMFTKIRGASNDKAKHDLGWQLIIRAGGRASGAALAKRRSDETPSVWNDEHVVHGRQPTREFPPRDTGVVRTVDLSVGGAESGVRAVVQCVEARGVDVVVEPFGEPRVAALERAFLEIGR